MEKPLLTPNRNPAYNRHYIVDILMLTIGQIPKYGFEVTCWGDDLIFIIVSEHRSKRRFPTIPNARLRPVPKACQLPCATGVELLKRASALNGKAKGKGASIWVNKSNWLVGASCLLLSLRNSVEVRSDLLYSPSNKPQKNLKN